MEEQKNLSRPRKLEKNPTVPFLTQLEHSKNFTSSMNFFLIFNWEQLKSEIILLSLRAILIIRHERSLARGEVWGLKQRQPVRSLQGD